MESIKINNNINIKPKLDVLGRNKGKEICIGTNKIAEEQIVYRKVGDHATNMPASIYFGEVSASPCVIKKCLKYAYDKMGNIEKIYKNGALTVRYTYDKLGRLIREDNKAFGKTWLMTYDTNGNILYKKETSCTLKEDLDGSTFTTKAYGYEGQRLWRYNGAYIEYNGSDTRPYYYRDKRVEWARGGLIASYNGHTFTYDTQGRRLTKDNITFTYDSQGRVVKQSNGLEFFYDHTGVVAVKYNGNMYFYRKDVQGNLFKRLRIMRFVFVYFGKFG